MSMITPVSFRLHNIRQHKDLLFEYRAGSVGIFGSNGSGKSNAFHKGQYFAITGKTIGDKESNLRDGASAGFTEFIFRVDGIEYTRKNKLPGSESTLKWVDKDGEKQSISGMKAVDERMQEILGASYDIIREVCFGRQEDLYLPVVSTKQQLLSFFQRVSGCQKAESIRTAIQSKLADIPVPVDNTEVIAESEKNLESGRKTYQDWIINRDSLKASLPGDIDTFRESRKHILGLRSPDIVKQELKDSQVKVCELDDRITKLNKQLEQTQAGEHVPDEWYDYANKYNTLQNKKQEHETLKQTAKKNIEEYRNIPVVQEPSREGVDNQKAKKAELDPVIALLDSGVCPTCKREYKLDNCSSGTDPDKVRETYNGLIESIRQSEDRYRQALEVYKENEQRKSRMSSILDENAKQLKQLQETVTALQTALDNAPDFSMEEYTRRVEHNKEVAARAGDMKAVTDSITRLTQEAESVRSTVAKLNDEETASEDLKEKAGKELESLAETLEKLKTAEGYVSSSEGWLKASEASLGALKEEHKKGEKLRKIRKTLTGVRDLLHRDVLPRFVMGRLVDGMNGWTNFYLRRFGKDFLLKLTPDFELLKVTRDGEETPCQDRLSGGELIAAALSFRMALGSLMVGFLPVQLLDEPTTWLDDNTRNQLCEVLRDLQNSVDSNMNILIPTHDQDIISSLEHAYSVDQGKYIDKQ